MAFMPPAANDGAINRATRSQLSPDA